MNNKDSNKKSRKTLLQNLAWVKAYLWHRQEHELHAHHASLNLSENVMLEFAKLFQLQKLRHITKCFVFV